MKKDLRTSMVPPMQVNMKFFDMFKKPKSFFPYKLQAGDTVTWSLSWNRSTRCWGDGGEAMGKKLFFRMVSPSLRGPSCCKLNPG